MVTNKKASEKHANSKFDGLANKIYECLQDRGLSPQRFEEDNMIVISASVPDFVELIMPHSLASYDINPFHPSDPRHQLFPFFKLDPHYHRARPVDEIEYRIITDTNSTFYGSVLGLDPALRRHNYIRAVMEIVEEEALSPIGYKLFQKFSPFVEYRSEGPAIQPIVVKRVLSYLINRVKVFFK